MTRKELSTALTIARSGLDLSKHATNIFDGYGLPGFQPVTVTILQLAYLVNWQCCCWNGSIDENELQNIVYAGRRLFMIV